MKLEVIVDKPEVLNTAVSELPDSSPSSPPMDTDDAGTTAPHALEISLITECDRSLSDEVCSAGPNVSVGLGNSAQLRVERYLVRDWPRSEGAANSVSAINIGIKYRFYDHAGLAIAVYPSLMLNDASRTKLPDGSVAPSTGHVLYLPLIISRQIGRQYTAIVNIGEKKNFEHPDQDSLNLSAAIGRAVSETSKIMAEVSSQRSRAEKVTYARFGWIKVIYTSPQKRYQTAVFTSIGRTIGLTPEGRPRYAFRLGLHVAVNPPANQ